RANCIDKCGALGGFRTLKSLIHNMRRRLSRAAHSLQTLQSMNAPQLKANRNIIKGRLKQKYAALTDDDLVYVEGKESEPSGCIQRRRGHADRPWQEALRCGPRCETQQASPRD